MKFLNLFLIGLGVAFSGYGGIVSAAEGDSSLLPEIHAFADTQYQWRKNSKSPGFMIYDGALLISKNFGPMDFLIDLPFAWNGLQDLDADGVAETNNNDFRFAKSKAQAYGKYTLESGFFFQVGQFDTIYGFELNDSKDIAFTNPGAVFNAALPVTHTGLLIDYSRKIEGNGGTLGTFAVDALISNPQNQGSLNGSNLEWGAQISFDNENLRLAAGYLGWDQPGAAGMVSLYDFLAGVTFGPVVLDTEFDLKKVSGADAGMAVMLHGIVTVCDRLSLGVRPEWIRKIVNHELLQLTAGPQYVVTKYLKLRGDYTVARIQSISGGTKEVTHALGASAVWQF